MANTLVSLKNQMNLREKGTVLGNLTVIVHDGRGKQGFVYTEDSQGYLVILGVIYQHDWSWGTNEPVLDCIGETLVILDYHPNGMYLFGRKHLTDKLSYIKSRIEAEGDEFLHEIFDGYINHKEEQMKDSDDSDNEYYWR